MRHFDIFCFFYFFDLIFFRNDFPNSLIVSSRSSLLFSQRKFFELDARTCPAMFFYSLYLLITFFVLHKSRFLRVTSDLLHSLFQWNGFYILSRIELRNVVNTVNVKSAKSKERDTSIKPGH